MNACEVAVIGAGPSGATLARLLAVAGVDVVLLERERLPRYKPCGGGVTEKAWPWLPPEAAAAVRWRVQGAELVLGRRRVMIRRGEGGAPARDGRRPAVSLVMRDEFDAALARAAAAAGARLREATPVLGLQEGAEAVELQLPAGERLRARFVAVAAGALGARLFPGRPPRFVPALEAELHGDGRMEAVSGDFAVMPGGYAWMFPKADLLSVGVATWNERPHGLPRALQSYIEAEGWSDLRRHRIQGHRIPVGGSLGAGDLCTERVLRVGDAGGFVEPVFGEGIYYAVRSAHLAAPALQAALAGRGRLDAYARAAETQLLARFRAMAVARRVLYGGIGTWVWAAGRFPGLGTFALDWAVRR